SNTDVAQRGYAAFVAGDMPGLLALCTPDIQWVYFGQVPWAGDFKRHEGVLQFFDILGKTLEFEAFDPLEFFEAKDAVTVLGTTKSKVRATGARFDNNWAHVFYVRDGQIAKYVGHDTQAIT
ncbi:nuclear transport factor 2 family protein, partial [Nostoc sp. NIES-2111]